MGKVIHWKKLKFYPTTKCNSHEPGSVQVNEKQKVVWDFETQMDYQIPARTPDLVIISKKKRKKKKKKRENQPKSKLCHSSRPQCENQRKRKERQVLRPCQRTKKVIEHESDGDTNCNWYTRNDSYRLGKEAERFRTQKTSGDHPNYHIIKIGRNTEKSPRKLRGPAVTQTQAENHLLALVCKTWIKIIITKKRTCWVEPQSENKRKRNERSTRTLLEN